MITSSLDNGYAYSDKAIFLFWDSPQCPFSGYGITMKNTVCTKNLKKKNNDSVVLLDVWICGASNYNTYTSMWQLNHMAS